MTVDEQIKEHHSTWKQRPVLMPPSLNDMVNAHIGRGSFSAYVRSLIEKDLDPRFKSPETY